VTAMNQTAQRATPPTRSSSLRCQSSASTVTVAEPSAPGKAPPGPGARIAVEMQRLHELKRQVAAQEQRLATLRTATNTAATVTDSNGTVGNGKCVQRCSTWYSVVSVCLFVCLSVCLLRSNI